MRETVPSVELLARRLCKLLQDRAAMTRAELEAGMAQALRQSPAMSPRLRRRVGQQDSDFDAALAWAVANGWMAVASDAYRLTDLGASFARRSRAVPRRARKFI